MDGAPDPDWYLDHALRHANPGGGRVVVGPVEQWSTWWRIADQMLADRYPALAAVARRQGFVLRTDQLCGVSRKRARTLVRHGTWSAPHRGVLALVDPTCEWDGSVAESWAVERRRHALACAAVALRNPGFVVSGDSAAILRGVPTVRVPSPELTAPKKLNAHRRLAATVPVPEVQAWYGVPVVSPARAVVDVARHNRRSGIVAADAALREGLVTVAELRESVRAARGWPGVRGARDVVELADPLAESPLESLTRLAFHDDGFPAPQLQVEFTVPGRRYPYRVDLYWPQFRLVVECDGRVKYQDGDAGEDRRWREKQRAVELHRLDLRVESVVWADVMSTWPETSRYFRPLLR